MSTYVILKKGTFVVAVNIVEDTAGDEIRSLKEQYFTIICDMYESDTSEKAINAWKESNISLAIDSTTKAVAYESNYKTAGGISVAIIGFGWLSIGIVLAFAGSIGVEFKPL